MVAGELDHQTMPHLFLHIHDRGHIVADGEGAMFSTVGTARIEAFRVMAELVADGAWSPNLAKCFIRIVDYQGFEFDVVYLWELAARCQDD